MRVKCVYNYFVSKSVDDWSNEFPENAQRILREDYADGMSDPIKEAITYLSCMKSPTRTKN